LPQKGNVRKKRKEKRKTKEGGLSPEKDQGRWSVATRRGREKKKKRKEKDHGRQEGGSSEGKVPCALLQEFLFFGSRVFGLGSGPSW
jgi:hypothetical protein